LLNFINVFFDALLLFWAYPLAVYVRFNVLDGQWHSDLFARHYYIMAFGYSVLSVFIYAVLKLYESQRIRGIYNKLILIALVNGISILCLGTFFYIIRLSEFPRMVLFLYWLFATAAVITKHVVVSILLRYYRGRGYNQKHILVVGNGMLAHQYMQDVKANPAMGYIVDGYVSAVEREELGRWNE
jgi:FlaA1/EpsC-like NDP-sugar epimerase